MKSDNISIWGAVHFFVPFSKLLHLCILLKSHNDYAASLIAKFREVKHPLIKGFSKPQLLLRTSAWSRQRKTKPHAPSV